MKSLLAVAHIFMLLCILLSLYKYQKPFENKTNKAKALKS